MTHDTREVEEVVKDFEKQFCTTIGAPGGPTIVRWLNLGSSDQENAELTSKMIVWLRKTLHHQLQKARQDWLREEIVRLEGMKKPLIGIHITLPADHEDVPEEILMRATPHIYNQALQTIIDRYQAELDQDKQ